MSANAILGKKSQKEHARSDSLWMLAGNPHKIPGKSKLQKRSVNSFMAFRCSARNF